MTFYLKASPFFILEDRIDNTTDTVEREFVELTGVKTTGPLSADKKTESFSSLSLVPDLARLVQLFHKHFYVLIRKIFPYK